MHLLDLPVEILQQLPWFLDDIQCFINTASTCRALRVIFSDANPRQILRLAAASSVKKKLFQPHPWFLLVSTAAALSDWAMESEANTARFREALREGAGALLDLSVSTCSLKMEQLRRIHHARSNIIARFTDLMDKMCGEQWREKAVAAREKEAQWRQEHLPRRSRVPSPIASAETDPERRGLQVIVYSELFKSTVRAYCYPERRLPKLPIESRLEYARYCAAPSEQLGGKPLNPCVFHGEWCDRWKAVSRSIAPDFEESRWRQRMWLHCIQAQGLDGMQALFPETFDNCVANLTEIRKAIENLAYQHRPRKHLLRMHERAWGHGRLTNDLLGNVYDVPIMRQEISMCAAALRRNQSSAIELERGPRNAPSISLI